MDLEINQKAFIVISLNMEINVFDSLDQAINSYDEGYLFLIHHTKNHETWNGNKHKIFNYQILDKKGNQRIISNNGWKLTEIHSGEFVKNINSKAKWKSSNLFRFIAPNGKVKTEPFSTYLHQDPKEWAPFFGLKFFFEISKFNNWEDYQLITENENLIRTNKRLEADNNKLYSKIKSLEKEIEKYRKK